MNTLTIAIPPASDTALIVMKAVIDENERERTFPNDEDGPLVLGSALSDFFQLVAALEQSEQALEEHDITEIAGYGLDLLDRLSYQLRELKIMDQRDNLSRVFATLAVWFARRGAKLDNLQGAADGFAWLTNGINEPPQLVEMCLMMEEVVEAASERVAADEDRENPWRPWRVLNLNVGVAATRALDPELMARVFDDLAQRLPEDVGGFFADGKRQMDEQDVPDAVREVLTRYMRKYPARPMH
ncbi:MAG: hypothetical protein ACPGU7_10745 [Gammaproteobacteria bacterium]